VLAGDGGVVLAEQGAPLGVAQFDDADAELREHRRRDLAGEGAVPPGDVLGADHDPGTGQDPDRLRKGRIGGDHERDDTGRGEAGPGEDDFPHVVQPVKGALVAEVRLGADTDVLRAGTGSRPGVRGHGVRGHGVRGGIRGHGVLNHAACTTDS